MKYETSHVQHPKLGNVFDNSDLNLYVSQFLSYKMSVIVARNLVGNHRLSKFMKHLHAMARAQYNHP